MIRNLGKDRTIILSTHNLPEVMETCDRLIVIHQGQIVADGTAQELEEQEASNPQVFLTVDKAAGLTSAVELETALKDVDGVVSVEVHGASDNRWTARLDAKPGTDIRPVLFSKAVAENWNVVELKRDALDLEGIFRKLTQ